MKALVLAKAGEIAIEDVQLAETLGPDDVQIKIHSVGICGSDVHYYQHGRIGPFVVNAPMVLGHEASGVVLATGKNVTHLSIGDRVIDLISDSADCVIRSGPLADSSLIARRLFDLDWVSCATPAYLARHGTPRHPCDLEQSFPMVHYRHPVNDRIHPQRYVERGKEIAIQQRYPVSINEGNALLAASLAGLGIIQIYRFMAQPHLERGELVSLLHDWQPPPEQMYVVYPSNRHLSGKLRAFIDWAVETFR